MVYIIFGIILIGCCLWFYKTFISVLNELEYRVALLENNSSIERDIWGSEDDIRTTERKL